MTQTLEELVNLPDRDMFERKTWQKFDSAVGDIPTHLDQRSAWEDIVSKLKDRDVPLGHPHFRLGVLHLIDDPDAELGIKHLEEAHHQDLMHARDNKAFQMGAYRVLCLVKDFLDDLQGKRDWKTEQLKPPHRTVLIQTLLAVYDHTAQNILELSVHTFSPFLKLISNDSLRRFAGENYYFAQELLERVSLVSGVGMLQLHQYPMARSIIALYGGVLEALLLDRLPNGSAKPLGRLIEDAHMAGVLLLGTRLTALATLMLYFRNHVHPGKDISRTDYFVDINVAKGIKVATDWVIADLLVTE